MEDVFKYLWMAVVAAVGGTIGFISKISPRLTGQALHTKIRAYLMGLVTSMFVAYITYEGSLFFIHSERLSVALAGLASFAGTDLLVILQQNFIEVIKRKLGGVK